MENMPVSVGDHVTPRVLPSKQSEADFLAQVIDLAHLYGWRVAHFRAGMTRTGRWLTPVQGDGAGFPDLLMTRGHRALALELKVGYRKATETQLDWLNALGHVPGIEAHVVHPKDWELIERMVK